MKDIKIIKTYREDAGLRASFNELAKKVFSLDFENWYQNGYWTDRYIPYSVVVDGKVVSNVSVNLTDFEWNGERKRLIQLGTVMTDEAYRKQGYSRKIMEEIEKDYAGKVDGMYLFANDSVLDFYPKFGFIPARQYQYVKEVSNSKEGTMENIPMPDKAAWDKIQEIIQNSKHCCIFDMVDNSQLNMFYLSQFMRENVYYNKELDVYVVAEIEGEELQIDMIMAKEEVDIDRVIDAFGENIKKVKLGFSPKQASGFELAEVKVDDCTLFVKGEALKKFEEAQIMFPVLAHA